MTVPVIPGTMSAVNLQTRFSLSPGAIDMVRLIALIAMLIDHFNTVLMPVPRLDFYALGRTAFPLFTLIWAMNVLRAPEKLSHRARRLWIWALVTQPVFMLTFYGHVPWYALNILFVFASVTQLLAFWYRSGISGALAGTVLLVCMIWPLTPASFGVQGLILALALVLVFSARSYAALLGGGCLVLVSLALLNGLPELGNNTANALKFAVLPTLVLPAAAVWMVAVFRQGPSPRFIPGSFFYCAYGGHLAVLCFIRYLL